jgi:glycosyltransferase involved in cell wall biosynthesis
MIQNLSINPGLISPVKRSGGSTSDVELHQAFKVAVLIPCFNEAEALGALLKKVPHSQLSKIGAFAEVFVIDNNSSDNTAEIARLGEARVIFEPKKGKGNAMRAAFSVIPEDFKYVLMLDGDGTYDPGEMMRLIELLESGFCDVAMGSRLSGNLAPGSMHVVNRFGNLVFTNLVRQLYGANTTDVLTGYFAWKRGVVDRLAPHLESEGFALEMEMVTKMSQLGNNIASVPITYKPRIGESNLSPFYDGARILWVVIRNLFWKPRN